MIHSRWWRVLGRHVAGLAVAFGALGPAQADYVTGTWDPVFGAPFTNLSWRGSILAEVPADCSELPAGIRTLAVPGCSVTWTTINAKVEFFHTDFPAVVVDTLDFTTIVSVDLLNVNALAEIDGLGSADPDPLQSVVGNNAALSPFGVLAGTAWGLKFDFVNGQTVASLYYTTDTGTCINAELYCFEGRNDVLSPAVVTVTEVPEPASLGLALLGLGFLARRTSRTSRSLRPSST